MPKQRAWEAGRECAGFQLVAILSDLAQILSNSGRILSDFTGILPNPTQLLSKTLYGRRPACCGPPFFVSFPKFLSCFATGISSELALLSGTGQILSAFGKYCPHPNSSTKKAAYTQLPVSYIKTPYKIASAITLSSFRISTFRAKFSLKLPSVVHSWSSVFKSNVPAFSEEYIMIDLNGIV